MWCNKESAWLWKHQLTKTLSPLWLCSCLICQHQHNIVIYKHISVYNSNFPWRCLNPLGICSHTPQTQNPILGLWMLPESDHSKMGRPKKKSRRRKNELKLRRKWRQSVCSQQLRNVLLKNMPLMSHLSFEVLITKHISFTTLKVIWSSSREDPIPYSDDICNEAMTSKANPPEPTPCPTSGSTGCTTLWIRSRTCYIWTSHSTILLKQNIGRCYSDLKLNIPTRNCIGSLHSQDLCQWYHTNCGLVMGSSKSY